MDDNNLNLLSLLEHEKQIYEYEEILKKLREQHQTSTSLLSEEEMRQMEHKLEKLKKKVYSNLTAWQRVAICRHPERPRALTVIHNLFDKFVEIHGDRLFRDDHSMVTGFAIFEGQNFVVIAQEKGCDTESRLYRNFGMNYPEGYRKAERAMQLAEKFHLPILCLIDTPGAYCGLDAEERGQGRAIAHNLMTMARLKTPSIGILIGEGCSGGALGIGITDRLAILEHAYYSVISPEGCASILWKDANLKTEAAEALKLHAESLLELGIVDEMIEEPLGGAHRDPPFVYAGIKQYLRKTLPELLALSTDTLLEERYAKYRNMGVYTI